MEGKPFLKEMMAEGIGVRAFEIFGKPYCRVSMGKKEEMHLFLDALKKVLV
jgi:histidinol-phosphate aminotransferase